MSGIIALTVCINYSDYLENTLPYNRQYFTEYYIVTEKTDVDTIKLAHDNSCKLLYYNIKKMGDATFNKSGLLYHAQKNIHQAHPDNWIAIVDADILLSNKFKYLNSSLLKKSFLYGIPRYDFLNYNDFKEIKNFTHYNIGNDNRNIVGFFQLYFDKTKYYPYWSNNCSQCDLDFKNKFDRNNIRLLDFIECYHFGEKDKNWNGRITDKFEKINSEDINNTLDKLGEFNFVNNSTTETNNSKTIPLNTLLQMLKK